MGEQKIFLTLLIREMQIKNTMKYHLILVRRTVIKKGKSKKKKENLGEDVRKGNFCTL